MNSYFPILAPFADKSVTRSSDVLPLTLTCLELNLVFSVSVTHMRTRRGQHFPVLLQSRDRVTVGLRRR